jgi:UDP-N-acetylmuramoyl-tripeptide--D-alanyl-D-alanine ligase
MKARMFGRPPRKTVRSVSTDTRTIAPGALFFALRGKRFDAHDLVDEAIRNGAGGIVVARDSKVARNGGVAVLVVDDTTRALMELAAYYRRRRRCRVVGITGSNGKTTVKDMLHHIIGSTMSAVKSPRSFNNQVGLPLTLFLVERDTRVAVVEHGTNSPGEIKALAAVSKPDIGIVTNVSRAHLKGTVGFSPGCDWYAEEIEQMPDMVRFLLNGAREITMPVLGKHNVSNALAAIAAATSLGAGMEEIRRRLASFSAPPMRLQKERVAGVTVINDAYNANPFSVGAAVAFLDGCRCSGRKVLVLGDMAELGRESRSIHRSIGRAILASDVDCVFTLGRDARHISQAAGENGKRIQTAHFADFREALDRLEDLLRPGDVLLLKASRHIKLERLIEALKPRLLKPLNRNRVQDAVCHSV